MQETLLNLLLRNYLHYNLYDQAEKLRSKAPRFEAHSNQQATPNFLNLFLFWCIPRCVCCLMLDTCLVVWFILFEKMLLWEAWHEFWNGIFLSGSCIPACFPLTAIIYAFFLWTHDYSFLTLIFWASLALTIFSCSFVDTSFTWERLGQYSWSTQMPKNPSFKLLGKPPLQPLASEFNATSGQSLSDYC